MVALPERNTINFIILQRFANWYNKYKSRKLLVFMEIKTGLHSGRPDFINTFYEYNSVFRVLF
jgi:hypothetical protein